MKKLIIIAFMCFAALSHAQTVKKDSITLVSRNATSATDAKQLTTTATLTGMTFKTSEGMLPVYLSSKGSYFVVRHSKKGTFYKEYLKQE